jgi:hypothetical protein
MGLRGASASAWLMPGGPPRLAGGGAVKPTKQWLTSQAGQSHLPPPPPPPPPPSAYPMKILFLLEFFLLEGDQSQEIILFLKLDVANEGGPVTSGLGRMVRSTSL